MPGAPRRGRGRPGQSPSPTVCAHRSRTCFRDPKEVTGDLHEGARGGPSALLCVWGRGEDPRPLVRGWREVSPVRRQQIIVAVELISPSSLQSYVLRADFRPPPSLPCALLPPAGCVLPGRPQQPHPPGFSRLGWPDLRMPLTAFLQRRPSLPRDTGRMVCHPVPELHPPRSPRLGSRHRSLTHLLLPEARAFACGFFGLIGSTHLSPASSKLGSEGKSMGRKTNC